MLIKYWRTDLQEEKITSVSLDQINFHYSFVLQGMEIDHNNIE